MLTVLRSAQMNRIDGANRAEFFLIEPNCLDVKAQTHSIDVKCEDPFPAVS